MSIEARPLDTYWAQAASQPFVDVKLDSQRTTHVRKLTMVERATTRVEPARSMRDIPGGASVLHEAAVRLFDLRLQGLLPHASGHWTADFLTRIFRREHPSRHATFGWILLDRLDALDLIKVTLSAEPNRGGGRQNFRTMRLHNRIQEFRQTEPMGAKRSRSSFQ